MEVSNNFSTEIWLLLFSLPQCAVVKFSRINDCQIKKSMCIRVIDNSVVFEVECNVIVRFIWAALNPFTCRRF
jgi:hypothetical protein